MNAAGTTTSRRDPLGWLMALVALVVYLPRGFDGSLTRDLGVYSYAGQQVAEGSLPYEAIINRSGPLAHLVPGVGAWVSRQVGVDDVLGMRVLFMLIAIASVAVSYLLGRDVFGSRLAGVAAATTMLCLKGFIIYATYGPREKTTMVLLLLLALLALVHQRWALTGVFISLATLTWQPVFFVAFTAAVVALVVGVREARLRALLRLCVGGLVPLVTCVVIYAATGQLRIFVDDFLIINARYTNQTSLISQPGQLWASVLEIYGWTWWVFLGGAVAQVVLAAVAFRRPGPRDARTAAEVGIGAAFLTGTLWSLRAFNGWPDNFFMFPGAALGIAGVVMVLARRVSARAALGATVGWLVLATGLSLAYSLANQDDTLEEQRADVAAVMDILPPGSDIFSVEAPQPLVLAHQRNASRFQLFGNGLADYLEDSWPGGGAGYARWIADQEPTVISVGTESKTPTWLSPVLTGGYVHVGSSPGWEWWVRSDLGTPTLAALTEALAG